MTQRLYYHDSYTRAFTAAVVETITIESHPAVVLDRTYFYPTGGGQPHDTGQIGGVEVLDVSSRKDYAIVHVVASEIEKKQVDARIDYPRRFDHMQQHTGQHILTRAFIEVAGANTVAFHLGIDSVTIDLDQASLAADVVDRVEDLANQIIAENRPITARIVSPDEFSSLNVRTRKMPDSLATDGIRIVEIADFDITACGGTHVSYAGEIGLIKVLKLERNATESRVEFRCGGRALRDYRIKNGITNSLAADLSVGAGEIDQAVGRLKADLRATRTKLKDVQNRLVDYEANALRASAEMRGDIRLIKAVFSDRDSAEVRALASRLNVDRNTIILFGVSGESVQLIFTRSANLPQDMNVALKSALQALGSDRGGGRPEFAQGGGISADETQLKAALHVAEQRILE
jgi:alanyl-tRNA synthetase